MFAQSQLTQGHPWLGVPRGWMLEPAGRSSALPGFPGLGKGLGVGLAGLVVVSTGVSKKSARSKSAGEKGLLHSCLWGRHKAAGTHPALWVLCNGAAPLQGLPRQAGAGKGIQPLCCSILSQRLQKSLATISMSPSKLWLLPRPSNPKVIHFWGSPAGTCSIS